MKYYDREFPCVEHFIFSNISTDIRSNSRQINFLNITFKSSPLSYRWRKTVIGFLQQEEPADHIQSVLMTSHGLALQYKVFLFGVHHIGRYESKLKVCKVRQWNTHCLRRKLLHKEDGILRSNPVTELILYAEFYRASKNFWDVNINLKAVAKIYWRRLISKPEVLMAYREELRLFLSNPSGYYDGAITGTLQWYSIQHWQLDVTWFTHWQHWNPDVLCFLQWQRGRRGLF
jgi:hypothetical protein